MKSLTNSLRLLKRNAVRHRSFNSKKPQFPKHLINVPPTKITTLPSGLRVVTEEAFGFATATVGMWIDAGSSFEDSETNGSAHFLEHMAFKGTNTRSKSDIEALVENLGGSLNAYTAREQTVYVTQCFKHDVGTMVELLSDILQRSELRYEDVEAERGTILKEKIVVEQKEDELLFDHMHAVCYKGHPLSLTILGETRNINQITREQLFNYITNNYTAPRMILVGTGAINHNQLVELADKHFGTLPTQTPSSVSQLHALDPVWHGSEIRVFQKSKPEIHVGIGFESVGWAHPHHFTFLIIQTIIGNWERNMGAGGHITSPLANALAPLDLVKSFQSFYTVYNKTGVFGLYLEIPPIEANSKTNISHVVQLAVTSYKFVAENLTEEEFQRAKNRVKSQALMTLDGSSAVAEELGRQILSLGRRIPPAELFTRIDAIQLEDVRDCIYTYLQDVCPSVVVIGPYDKSFPTYNAIRDMTIW